MKATLAFTRRPPSSAGSDRLPAPYALSTSTSSGTYPTENPELGDLFNDVISTREIPKMQQPLHCPFGVAHRERERNVFVEETDATPPYEQKHDPHRDQAE